MEIYHSDLWRLNRQPGTADLRLSWGYWPARREVCRPLFFFPRLLLNRFSNRYTDIFPVACLLGDSIDDHAAQELSALAGNLAGGNPWMVRVLDGCGSR